MQLLDRLAGAVTLLLLLALSISAAQLTWRFAAPYLGGPLDSPPPSALAAVSLPLAAQPAQGGDYRALVGLHLFGESQASLPVEVEKTLAAPKTNLQLTLRGLYSSDDPTAGLAIIADSANRERPYRIGDSLPGNAVVREIHPQRVLLERNGRLESLELPKQRLDNAESPITSRVTTTAAARPSPVPQAAPAAPTPSPQAVAEPAAVQGRLKRELLASPAEISRHLDINPLHEEGEITGYRVAPKGDGGLFRNTGLSEGDVIIGVNGMGVNDAELLGKLMLELNSANEITLEVINGNRKRNVTVVVD